MTSAQESLALMAVDNGVPSLGGNAHNDNLYKAECFARQSQVGSCVLCLDFEISLGKYHSSSIGAQVENGNLDGSQIFSEYFGLDHMLAIVCKSNEGVKHLEPYDQKGKINKSSGLHGGLVSLGKFHSSSIGARVEYGNLDGSQSEEKTIAQISQIENSVARVVCELKNGHTDQVSNPSLINNVLGVVATLGKVEDDNLSSAYFGFYAVRLLLENRCYCAFIIQPYVGELAPGDPQKKLALPKPRLPNGTCPSGFIDFAVNMINVEIANSSCLTASGLGLGRLYSIAFSLACKCIKQERK
ncbi:hypothetical protein Syun_018506 [Stephania yunnanensis]|uniref:Uncharacterized protein n=1 Tax=Stephania yunnanensis TaxID=152371 RepID=A0AAP0ISH9_9MAGN